MLILNLACGTKTSADRRVLNIDWNIYLRFKVNPFLRPFAPLFFKGERWTKFQTIPENILVHDLIKGIPYADSSVDAIFHAHFLEHIDRSAAPVFLAEVLRALRPGGIHRIVVPDFEVAVRRYYQHLEDCEAGKANIADHDARVGGILWWSVLREATGTSHQRGARRWLENKILGDARKRGQTHQWMYDRFNLAQLLKDCGYVDVQIHTYRSSSIQDWDQTGLDNNPDGSEYKPESLYIEARKPLAS